MGVDLPSAREWLNAELARRNWTGRELARQAGVPSSSISKFATGEAGPQICLDVARGLSVSPLVTLAVGGLIPPPPRADDLRWGTITTSYGRLDENGRNQLLEYAQFLLIQQQRRSVLPGGEGAAGT